MDLSQLFKDLIFNTLVKAALAKLFAAVPLLGWGPIGWIVSLVVGKIAEWLFDNLAEAVNFEVIVLRKESLAKEYARQVLSLKQLAQTNGIDSEEFKAQREKAKVALAQFIHFA